MKFTNILFDLDGTLIDTNQLIIDSFKHTIKEHLNADAEETELLKYFGEPLLLTLQRFSAEKADQMFDTYITYNEFHHDQKVLPCLGIQDGLSTLNEMGCKLAIVTSKRNAVARKGLRLFDLENLFSTIVTLEDTKLHKPNPEPILEALKLLNAKPEQSIMIGDSIYDIECAKNAGVKSVLVKWSAADGYQDKKIEADYIVSCFDELIEIIKG